MIREKHYGIGINDADWPLYTYEIVGNKKKRIGICPFYMRWVTVLSRCYSPKELKRNPSYLGCGVCDEWRYLSNFRSWMETQDWEGNQLDKDLLVRGNKTYSPETCIFVSQDINKFLTDRANARGAFPIGVYFEKDSGKYKAQGSGGVGKRINLGRFGTPEEAHKAWLTFKLEQAYVLAERQSDERVAKALIDRYENYVMTFSITEDTAND